MKTLMRFLLLFLSTLLSTFSFAQELTSGDYQGILEIPGMTLEMAIHLDKSSGSWEGDLDIPKQQVKNMKLADLVIADGMINFTLPEVPGNASYEGKIMGDTIQGKFSQSGAELDLDFILESKEIDIAAYADRISQIIDSILPHANVPGLGVGVLFKDEIVLSEGFGYSHLEGQIRANNQTMFAIGSSSKAFTAAGVAKLVSEGKLKWDEPIRNHIPDFVLVDDYATQHMNAIDILCHRSGLPRHDLLWYGTPFSRDELLLKLRHVEPNKTFRETWQYQNLMFMTAGVLIERLSDQSWEDFTRKQIFEPLGMKESNFSVEKLKTHSNAALPYRYDNDAEKQRQMDYRNIDAIGPAGSINSSAEDMLKWIAFQLNQGQVGEEEIISSGDFAFMHSPQMLMPGGPRYDERSAMSYGLGWMLHWYKGMKIVEHGGNIDGFSAQVLLVPEKELGVVVLSNRNGTPLPSVLSYEIVDIMLDYPSGGYLKRIYGNQDEENEEEEEEADEEDEEETTQIKGTQFSKPISEYEGTYSHPGYGEIIISLHEDSLLAQYYDLDFTLTHYHFDIFEGEFEDIGEKIRIQFHMDTDGNISELSSTLEPQMEAIRFEKKGDKKFEDPDYLDQFVGNYKTPDLNIKVEIKNSKLYISPAGQPSYELIPMDMNKFKPKDLPGFSIEFMKEDGKIVSAKLNQPNGLFTADRIE